MPEKDSATTENSIEARAERLILYTEAHTKIKRPRLSKFFSGIYNSIMRLLTLFVACILFLAFLVSLFTGNYTLQISSIHDTKGNITLEDCYKYIGLVCLMLGLLFLWISTQINTIKKKNRDMHSLSDMLEKMLESEKKNLERDKPGSTTPNVPPTPQKDPFIS